MSSSTNILDTENLYAEYDRCYQKDSFEVDDQKVKEFISIVTERDSNNCSVPWNAAVKFLMARKFEVHRAITLYNQHELVRRREGLSIINPKETVVKQELLSEKFTVLSGRDSLGATIALFTARNHNPHTTNHQATLKSLVFQLDTALESLETQRNGLVFIYDMTSSKYSNFDYELSIKILNLLKGAYPARLKKVLIVTAPLWFKAPFKVMRLFVREKLRDRVFTVNREQLVSSNHIPSRSLPRRLGGSMDVNHREWIAKCLQLMWGKSEHIDNDIAAYMETHNDMPRELSVNSFPSGVSTPSPDGSSSFSDHDSECSRGTVSEKHTHEYHEKELQLDNSAMDISDSLAKTNSSTKSPKVSLDKVKTISCSNKRGSDTSPSEAIPGEQDVPPLLRKKVRDTEDSIHMPESGGYSIKDFMEYSRIKARRGLIREYEQIKAEAPKGSFEASKSRPNLHKNRYTDVLSMDHSRVKLSTQDNDPYSDYINANFVDGYKHKAAYISTQGPLPRTFEDFWRMVWEQSVLLIVMATRTVERSRLKCGQYWPLEDEMSDDLGDFVVINNGAHKKENYILTSLLLQNGKTNEMREISHFQFVSWPDYGVPHSAEAFLDFMFHVREKQAERLKEMGSKLDGHPEGPPIVIHCSAGIGRTGTFITVDILTKRLADIGTVDVNKTVRRIRSQRAFSIQMPDQYVFIHLALIEHAHRQGLISNIHLDGFEDSSSESESGTES